MDATRCILLVFAAVLVLYTKSICGARHQHTMMNSPAASMFWSTPPAGLCSWFNQSRRQHRMCRKEEEMRLTLLKASSLAVYHCQEQFKFDRWNCSVRNNGRDLFRKAYRETALLYAISAAGIVHAVSRACAEGRLTSCTCAADVNAEVTRQVWKWGGCGDNVVHGRKFTRRFLELRREQDLHSGINRHNSEVGIQIVANSVGDFCKCHGVSGSCSMKTCWKRLSPFEETAARLKDKFYFQAVRGEVTNTANRRSAKKLKYRRLVAKFAASVGAKIGQLVYLERSPSYCSVTAGRTCSHRDNCATLCCGRGFNTHMRTVTRSCNCHADRCCYVQCDTCSFEEQVFTCK